MTWQLDRSSSACPLSRPCFIHFSRPAALKQALQAVKTFKPLTGEQMASLLTRTAEAAADGHFEPFKTTSNFDSTAKHPE